MYGGTITAALMSIVTIGIINPTAGILMIATGVFGTLVLMRVQNLKQISKARYVPREI